MDPERERIEADLRGLVDCEVRFDEPFLQMYASDASVYEIRPLGVVRPRGVGDVVACVDYAAENGIPVHARGAGTGVAGESLGPGLILDFSHAMRRILSFDDQTGLVRLQPGVVLAQLNRYLAPSGRLFGPDPATRSVTTMGSVIAVDGSGSHWPQYGAASGRVKSLELVLADGRVLEVGRHSSGPPDDAASDPAAELAGRLHQLLEGQANLIGQHGQRVPQNRCGYAVHETLVDDQVDLARLICGSEGTLALITEATIQTDPIPPVRGLAMISFRRLDAAARGALEAAALGVSACDLMDRRLLTIARETDVRYDLAIPAEAEALLLVECHGSSFDEVRDRLHSLVERLQRRKDLAFEARITLDREERDLYWKLARRVVPRLYRLKGSSRPLPFVEDVAVPPAELPEFLVELQNVFKNHEITASVFAHASHGQLHVRPFLDLADPDDVRRMQLLANDIYERALAVGGTISAEHGVGLSRSWFMQRQCGPLYDVFREVKRIFDPQNILNPGKVVAEAPQPLTKNLRPVVAEMAGESRGTAVPLELQLQWSEGEFAYAARSCNGCGRCRTTAAEERMCPIFRFAPREEASPRAKANLMRGVLTGRLDPHELSGDALKSLADLCVNCHQCRLECPASVDIPKLMAECKAQYTATNGLRPSDWFLTRIDLLASLGSRLPSVTNSALANRSLRWLLEKTTGIAHGRKLPRLARRSFLRLAHRRRLTRPTRRMDRKVVFFVDLYANWFDVQLAEALVAVLEHNGVSVFVPPGQLPCGMPQISLGAAADARRLARHNVTLLADAVRQGYHVVATEPAAALCLQHEYPNLLDDDDVRLVAENTSEACHYLWRLHQSGHLELDLKPINLTLGYHLPCHLKALGVGAPGEHLLRLVPGIQVLSLEKGCSGMAGTFGLKRENYRSSLRAGWGLISALRNPAVHHGATECSACRLQMEQGTTKPTLHPLKVLALAYGLMPELQRLFTARSQDLVVS